MIFRKHILVVFLCLFTVSVYAQGVNCSTSIIDAEEMYRNGKYDDAIQILKTALKECSFSKREKEDAYLILVQAYLEKENYLEANQLTVKILNNDPNFKLKENLYQEDFYTYYKTIKIRPLFSAGVKLGINSPKYTTKQLNTVYNSASYASNYKPLTGYQYSIFAEWQFYDNLAVIADGSFSKIGYTRTINGTANDSLKISYAEALKSFETSLCLKKYFLHKQFRPFVYIGGYLSSINSATADIGLTYKLKDAITPDVDDYYLSKSNVDVLEMRNKKRQGIVAGAGVSYKMKNILISADASYRNDIGKHLTNDANKYKNDELLYKYYYIDNDVVLSRIDLSLSISYIFKYSIKSKLNEE